MLEIEIEPRFCETDALGHISNVVLLDWFEQARKPIFKIFIPDLDPKKWNLILAKNEVEYLSQLYFKDMVKIKTYLSKIGNSSMIIEHELYQNGIKAAHGKLVMIHFDYQSNKSVPLTENQKHGLEKLLVKN